MDSLWKAFLKSGAVGDYLRYRACCGDDAIGGSMGSAGSAAGAADALNTGNMGNRMSLRSIRSIRSAKGINELEK